MMLQNRLRFHRLPLAILLLTFGSLLIFLFAIMIRVDSRGLTVAHEHVWSDWGLHIDMINIFATRPVADWFIHHPVYAYGKFSYPFLTNLISGLIYRVIPSLEVAIIIPSICYSLLMLVGLYVFVYQITRSRSVSVTSVAFFLLSSGPGFLQWLSDISKQPFSLARLVPDHFYTRIDTYQWYSGNVISGILLPQRAFLIGFCIAIWALNFFLLGIHHSQKTRRYFLFAGILAGILPIAHMHSFIALIILSTAIMIGSGYFKKKLFWYIIPAGILSSVLFLLFIYGGIENPHFFTWQPGWTARAGWKEWMIMWIRLWGLTLPIAAVGLGKVIQKKQWLWVAVSIGFLVLFLLPNLILFQPVPWDNSKLFMWSYSGFSMLAAFVTVLIWRKNVLGKIFAILLAISLCATGTLDLIRLVTRATGEGFQISSSEDIAIGKLFQTRTDPHAIVLATPAINHAVMVWSARPILMSYWVWDWNFGFTYEQRQQDIHTMYQGGAEATALLSSYRISYVTIGPWERSDEHPNISYFETFPVAFATPSYTVYDVRGLTGGP